MKKIYLLMILFLISLNCLAGDAFVIKDFEIYSRDENGEVFPAYLNITMDKEWIKNNMKGDTDLIISLGKQKQFWVISYLDFWDMIDKAAEWEQIAIENNVRVTKDLTTLEGSSCKSYNDGSISWDSSTPRDVEFASFPRQDDEKKMNGCITIEAVASTDSNNEYVKWVNFSIIILEPTLFKEAFEDGLARAVDEVRRNEEASKLFN